MIARQDKIPSSDVRPWSDLTKDQRNGWRGWASELLALIDTPALPALRDLLAERDTLAAQVQAVEELLRFWDLADTPASVMEIDLRRALGTPTTEAGQ